MLRGSYGGSKYATGLPDASVPVFGAVGEEAVSRRPYATLSNSDARDSGKAA